MGLKSYNKLYTGELIEIVQKLLVGKLRPQRKKTAFQIFKSNDDFDETPYRLSLDEALKLTEAYRKEAKYRFKEWSKEDYFSAYLAFIEMEKARKLKEEEERAKKQKEEEWAKKKNKANAAFEEQLLSNHYLTAEKEKQALAAKQQKLKELETKKSPTSSFAN